MADEKEKAPAPAVGMSRHFFVTGATCNLIVRTESFPAISINIDGITDRMGVLPDAIKMAAFEKSVEEFVSQELPKFVQFEEVAS